MKKEIIFSSASFAAGILAGGAASYLYMNQKMNKMNDEFNKEVNLIRIEERTKYEKKVETLQEEMEMERKFSISPLKPDLKSVKEKEKTKKGKNTVKKKVKEVEKIEELKDDYNDDPEEDDDSSNEYETVLDTMKSGVPKEFISNDEFYNGTGYMEKRQILYYIGDNVLVDEQTGKQIENIDNTVGLNFEEGFDMYEDDMCFVRNNEEDTDYCIQKVSGYGLKESTYDD